MEVAWLTTARYIHFSKLIKLDYIPEVLVYALESSVQALNTLTFTKKQVSQTKANFYETCGQ